MKPIRDGAQRGNRKFSTPLLGFIEDMMKNTSGTESIEIRFDRVSGEVNRVPGRTRAEVKTRVSRRPIDSVKACENDNSYLLSTYWINYPVLSDTLFKPLARQIADDILANDTRDPDNRWIEKYPRLWSLIGDHISVSNPDYHLMIASGLVELLRCYIDDVSQLVAMLSSAITWLLPTGHPTASRCSDILKNSWRFTLEKKVQGIPMLKSIYSAIIDQQKPLGMVDENGTIILAFPLYNNFFSPYISSDVNTRYDGLNYLEESNPSGNWKSYYPRMFNAPPTIGCFTKGDIRQGLASHYAANDTLYSRGGPIGTTIRRSCEFLVERIRNRWNGICTLPSDPLLQFFVSDYPILDFNIDFSSLQTEISTHPIYDLSDFINKNMRYSPLPGPVMSWVNHPSHPVFTFGDIRRGDNVYTHLAASVPHAYNYEEIRWKVERNSDYPDNDFPNIMFHPQFRQYFEDEGYSFLGGIPHRSMWMGYHIGKDHHEIAERYRDVANYGTTRANYSIAFDGGHIMKHILKRYPPELYVNNSRVIENFDMTYHNSVDNTGVTPTPKPWSETCLRRDVLLTTWGYAVYDSEDKQYIDTLTKYIEQSGAFLIPAELDDYFICPRALISPTINNKDPLQCGLWLVIPYENNNKQFGRVDKSWYESMKSLLVNVPAHESMPEPDPLSVWSSDDTIYGGLNNSKRIKDGIVFVGDGLHFPPTLSIDRQYCCNTMCVDEEYRNDCPLPVSIYVKTRILDNLTPSWSDQFIKNIPGRHPMANNLFIPRPDFNIPDPNDEVDNNIALSSAVLQYIRMYPQYSPKTTHPELIEVMNPEALYVRNLTSIIDKASNLNSFITYGLSTAATVAAEMPKEGYNTISGGKAFNSRRLNPLNVQTGSSKSVLLSHFNDRNTNKLSDNRRTNNSSTDSGKSYGRNKSNYNSYGKHKRRSSNDDKIGFKPDDTKRFSNKTSHVNKDSKFKDNTNEMIPEVNDGKEPPPVKISDVKQQGKSVHSKNYQNIDDKGGAGLNAKNV